MMHGTTNIKCYTFDNSRPKTLSEVKGSSHIAQTDNNFVKCLDTFAEDKEIVCVQPGKHRQPKP